MDDKKILEADAQKKTPEEIKELLDQMVHQLNDIALSLRVLSERSTIVKTPDPKSYKAKYFAKSDESDSR